MVLIWVNVLKIDLNLSSARRSSNYRNLQMQHRFLLKFHFLVGNGVCDSMLGSQRLTWFSGKATMLEISDSVRLSTAANSLIFHTFCFYVFAEFSYWKLQFFPESHGRCCMQISWVFVDRVQFNLARLIFGIAFSNLLSLYSLICCPDLLPFWFTHIWKLCYVQLVITEYR